MSDVYFAIVWIGTPIMAFLAIIAYEIREIRKNMTKRKK